MSQRSATQAPVILLVEDDRDIRTAITEVLRLEGYQVQGADDIDAAMGQLGHGLVPHLILLDMNLPPHGNTACVPAPLRVREISDAPIVVMSADGDYNTTKALAGVVDVLEKPFEISKLIQVIEQHRR